MIAIGAVLVFLFFTSASAFFKIEKGKDGMIKWNGLRVTYGREPSDRHFAPLPRTTSHAKDAGFSLIDECSETKPWRGARYVKGTDYGIILLYDVQGFIAGVQTSIPYHEDMTYPSKKSPGIKFDQDGNRLVSTVYFIDPALICTKGRNAENFDSFGTGVNLYFQNGTAKDSIMVPRSETDVIERTTLVQGKSFYRMGMHYWFDVDENMDCSQIVPWFLMFNDGQLTGFGWAFPLDMYSTSPRFEKQSFQTIGKTMSIVPKCLKDAPGLSSMHLFLTDIETGSNSAVSTHCFLHGLIAWLLMLTLYIITSCFLL